MSVHASLLDGAGGNEALWDEYVKSRPDATFFHQMGWLRVVASALPYRALPLVAKRGSSVVGILPLHLVPCLPLGRALISIPLATYGGALADDDEAERALLQEAANLANRQKVRYVEFRNLVASNDLPTKDLYVTFRKSISDDVEQNMATIPRKQRRMIRKGIKSGLLYRVGGREFLRSFYRVYSHSVRNLGSPVYPVRLFTELLDEFGESCRILDVSYRGETVAAVMTFFFRDQVIPYYGGALRSSFRLAANDFMYWSLMCHAAGAGYKVYDFGRSKKNTGPYNFKRHWGFEPQDLAYQYQLVRQKTIPDFSPVNPKFNLPIRVWQRLPVWLTQRLGPSLVRYFP